MIFIFRKVIDKIRPNGWIFVVIMSLLPFALTILLSVPSMDDFTEALSIRNNVKITGSVFLTAIIKTNAVWKEWSGDWPMTFFQKLLNPLIWSNSDKSVGIVLLMAFIVMPFVFFSFVRSFIKDLMGITSRNVIAFLFIVVLTVIMNSDIYPEIFNWYVGNSYLWELLFSLLNIICIIEYFSDMEIKKGILLSLVGFVACFGYLFAVSAGIFYLLMMYHTGKRHRIGKFIALYPLGFMILGGCLSVFAPGNFARHSLIEEELHLKSAIISTIPVMMKVYVGLFSNVFFVLGLLGAFSVAYVIPKDRHNIIHISPLFMILGQFFSVYCMIFCVVLGYGDKFIILPNRMEFIANTIVIIWSIFTAFILGVMINDVGALDEKKNYVKNCVTIVGLVLLLNGVNSTDNFLESIPWVYNAINLADVVIESNYNLSLIDKVKNSDSDDVYIVMNQGDIPRETGIIKSVGLSSDSEDWANVAIAQWYRKKSITFIVQ